MSGHHPTPLCHAIIDLDLGTPLKTFSSTQNASVAMFKTLSLLPSAQRFLSIFLAGLTHITDFVVWFSKN